jgi:hypothetical protein
VYLYSDHRLSTINKKNSAKIYPYVISEHQGQEKILKVEREEKED